MTIKELKEIIQDFSDDMDILVWVDSDLKLDNDLWAVGTLSKKDEIGTWYLCQQSGCWQDRAHMEETYDDEIREINKLTDDNEITDEHVDNFLQNVDRIEGIQLKVIPA